MPRLLSGETSVANAAVTRCERIAGRIAASVIAVMLGTAWAACYEAPDFADAHFQCDADHPCPTDQSCVNGHCQVGDPPAVGVECGGVTCATDSVCCVDLHGNATCIAPGGACDGVTAACDGAEDCGDGACCASSLGATTACGEATCDMQICREDADCLLPATPTCCLGVGFPGAPWGLCGDTCPSPSARGDAPAPQRYDENGSPR